MNYYKPKKLKISLVFDKRSYTDIRTYIEIGEAAILINVFCLFFCKRNTPENPGQRQNEGLFFRC